MVGSGLQPLPEPVMALVVLAPRMLQGRQPCRQELDRWQAFDATQAFLDEDYATAT